MRGEEGITRDCEGQPTGVGEDGRLAHGTSRRTVKYKMDYLNIC